MVAAFGAWRAGEEINGTVCLTKDPFKDIGDPVGLARHLADYTKKNYFDGIDVDYEITPSLHEGPWKGLEWLRIFSQELRNNLPKDKYIITHAP